MNKRYNKEKRHEKIGLEIVFVENMEQVLEHALVKKPTAKKKTKSK